MARIEGVKGLLSKLKNKLTTALEDKDKSVVVGYEAPYAVVVHEDLEAAHGAAFNVKHAAEISAGKEKARGDNQQAKYLEAPFRIHKERIKAIVAFHVQQGMALSLALYQGGLFLQAKSMEVVPVDLNNLKPSAFTEIV